MGGGESVMLRKGTNNTFEIDKNSVIMIMALLLERKLTPLQTQESIY